MGVDSAKQDIFIGFERKNINILIEEAYSKIKHTGHLSCSFWLYHSLIILS